MFRFTFESIATPLAVGLITAAAITPSFALDPMRSAPEESDFIMRADFPTLLDSPLTDMIIEEIGRQQVESMAKFIENATDLNVFEDINEVWIFSRVERDEDALIFIQGEFNQEKMLDMVRINQSYKELTVSGLDVHYWEDDSINYATFIDGYLIFGGSENAIRSLARTQENPASSVAETELMEEMTSDSSLETAVWAMLINRSGTEGDFGNLARGIDLEYALLKIIPGEENINASLFVKPKETRDTGSYSDVANGLLAMATLLQEEHEIAAMVSDEITMREDTESGSIVFELEVSNHEVFDVIQNIDQYN